MGSGCTVNGCDKPHNAFGMCVAHYTRFRKHGHPQENIPLGGQRPARRREHVKYWGAHKRVRREWGNAGQYPCVKCGGPGRDWAYDYTDPEPLFENGMEYSKWPEFYMPMCHSCHLKMDRNREGYLWRGMGANA